MLLKAIAVFAITAAAALVKLGRRLRSTLFVQGKTLLLGRAAWLA